MNIKAILLLIITFWNFESAYSENLKLNISMNSVDSLEAAERQGQASLIGSVFIQQNDVINPTAPMSTALQLQSNNSSGASRFWADNRSSRAIEIISAKLNMSIQEEVEEQQKSPFLVLKQSCTNGDPSPIERIIETAATVNSNVYPELKCKKDANDIGIKNDEIKNEHEAIEYQLCGCLEEASLKNVENVLPNKYNKEKVENFYSNLSKELPKYQRALVVTTALAIQDKALEHILAYKQIKALDPDNAKKLTCTPSKINQILKKSKEYGCDDKTLKEMDNITDKKDLLPNIQSVLNNFANKPYDDKKVVAFKKDESKVKKLLKQILEYKANYEDNSPPLEKEREIEAIRAEIQTITTRNPALGHYYIRLKGEPKLEKDLPFNTSVIIADSTSQTVDELMSDGHE